MQLSGKPFVFPLAQSVDPRTPSGLVPACVKWINDELDEMPSLQTLQSEAPLVANAGAAHHVTVAALRALSPQSCNRLIKLATARDGEPGKTSNREDNADEWERPEFEALHHLVHTVELLGVCYVRNESDDCVRRMFARIVRSDETYTAIYPFETMSKVPSALITLDFNPRFWKESLQKSLDFRQQDLVVFEEMELLAVGERAKRKVRHYKRGLEEVIQRLRVREAELDRMIATGVIPYGGKW